MRILFWFTLGFGAACGFCAYGRTPLFLILPALVLLTALLSPEKRRNKILISALGITCGFLWFSRFETKTIQPVYALDGVTMETAIRCSSFPKESPYGIQAEGTIPIGDRDYTVLCYLDSGDGVVPGAELTGTFRFEVTAPGGRRESDYYHTEGIYLMAAQRKELSVTAGETRWQDNAALLRQKILSILDDSLPEDAAMFAKALLLGDTSDLDYQTRTDFTLSGIRHIVAVSGLHVSILFSLVYAMSFRGKFLSVLMAFPSLLLFACMTGFTPSVSRACIMSGVMLLGMIVRREYDAPTSLSFAALILLLVNPMVIASVSFQLSFASVAGIFLFSTQIRTWMFAHWNRGWISRYINASVSITLGAMVLTVPLGALHFGSVSLTAVLTNLLVLWVASTIFYGLMTLCLFRGFWAAGAAALAKGLTFLIRYVLVTAKVIAQFPLSAVYIRSPYMLAWLIFTYLLLAVYLIGRNKYPSRLTCCAALGLCIALLAAWTEPKREDFRLTVLDVGQGQSLLLQSEGKAFLVDCGGTSDTVAADAAAETLLSQGISRLDGMIITHGDFDHAGGAEEFLNRVKTDLLILPPHYPGGNYPAVETVWASEDMTISYEDTQLQIFASQISGINNENSLCILFDTENCDILVTGDRSFFGEQALLRHTDLPDVDVLIAGHHGSKTATGEELLAAVRPEIVCISADRDNQYGSPAPELLQRLESYGCTVYRTDLHGDIIIRR